MKKWRIKRTTAGLVDLSIEADTWHTHDGFVRFSRYTNPTFPVDGHTEVLAVAVGEVRLVELVEERAVTGKLNTYAYCPNCDKVTEAIIKEPTPCITPTTPGRWAAGDIICRTCYAIIATLFQNLDEEPTAVVL